MKKYLKKHGSTFIERLEEVCRYTELGDYLRKTLEANGYETPLEPEPLNIGQFVLPSREDTLGSDLFDINKLLDTLCNKSC